jgi:urea transport system permease protein
VKEVPAALAVLLVLAALPQVIEGYAIYILPQYMLFGVMAMSLALLWGACGILSFGQAGFFALGGYAMGLAIGQEWAWLNGGYLGLLAAVAVCAVVAAAIGYFLFSAGVRDSYFVLVTLALSIMVEQIAVSQSEITGGWNGMFINRLTLGPLELTEDAPIYYVMLVVAALVYAGLRTLQSARFGKVLVGIRENEPRMEALGYATPLHKTAAFALSAGLAGLAGALYATHAGFVAPSLGGVLFSTEVVVWVAVAGRDSLLAAFLGGLLVPSLSNYLSAISPSLWQLFMGGLFIAAITLFRGGVAGFLGRLASRWGRGS